MPDARPFRPAGGIVAFSVRPGFSCNQVYLDARDSVHYSKQTQRPFRNLAALLRSQEIGAMRFGLLNAAVALTRENRHIGGATPVASILLPAASVGVPIRIGRAGAFTQTTRRLPDSVQRRRRSV